MKPVAVIILNWNGADMLSRYLGSVIRHTPADIADIIVADNGSTDDSMTRLADEFPDVKVLAFDKNLGYAGGYNEAIRRTGSRYTVLLNSDVEVKGDWLTPLFRYMETHPSVAAVQPKILSIAEPTKFEYAGAAGGFLDRNGYPYCRGRIFDTVETDHGQYDSPMEISGDRGGADSAYPALLGCRRARQPFFRPHGGNRSLLAAPLHGLRHSCGTSRGSLPPRRWQPAGIVATQDLPQLPQFAADAI